MTEALFGLLGVVIGSLIAWVREEWSDRKLRAKRARYLSVRIVCILDKYIDSCIDIVQDDGLCCGQRNEDGYLEPQVSLPKPLEYPDDVDWKSIRSDLMYDLLMFPNESERANRSILSISNEGTSPPGFEELFEARHYEYAVLGLHALDLATRIREYYEIPIRRYDDFCPNKFFETAKNKIDQRQARNFLTDSRFDEKRPDGQKLSEAGV